MLILPDFLSLKDRWTIREVSQERFDQYEPGRQGTGYFKLFVKDHPRLQWLIQRSLSILEKPAEDEFWDAWLLRYPSGSYIPRHLDEAEMFGKKHHRMNAIVDNGGIGGTLVVYNEEITLLSGDAYVFRPDIMPHEVTRVEGQDRLVWSVGCWK